MEGLAALSQTVPAEHRGPHDTLFDVGVPKSSWARRTAVAGIGLAGLVVGGFPLWAAHRILYPVHSEPMPHGLDRSLTIENGIAGEYVEFGARDGKTLSGWFVPPNSETAPPWPVVLLVYGYGGHKEQMVGYAQMLHDSGFATFMFDMRGSGKRRGEPVTLGHKERWDMLDASRYVATRPDVDPQRIAALGVSMGAATALLGAEQDPTIRAVVADSSYASLTDMIQPGLKAFVGSPASIFAPLIVRFAETMLGMKSADVRPVDAAANLGERPLFVIHGASDLLTPPDSAQRIYDAASGPKELWLIPECAHANGPVLSPSQYKARIASFFRTALAIS